MSLVKINWKPTRKDIRIFGAAALLISVVAASVFYFFKGLGLYWAVLIFIVGLVTFACCMFSWKLGKTIYLTLTFLTLPIGWVVNFVILFLFYFLLITPLGLFFRLTGRDVMGRRFDPNAKSYWQPHCSSDAPERYFRQF
jgi:hypothetical protein